MIDPDKVIHIYPHDEESDHVIFLTYPAIGEPYSECKCEPWFKKADNGHLLIIHASFNGREALEWANNILNKTTIMTPKEKAEEILDKLSFKRKSDNSVEYIRLSSEDAKQCAIICVEQIIAALKEISGSIKLRGYYQDVLEHIKNQ